MTIDEDDLKDTKTGFTEISIKVENLLRDVKLTVQGLTSKPVKLILQKKLLTNT